MCHYTVISCLFVGVIVLTILQTGIKITVLLSNPFDSQRSLNGVAVDNAGLLQNRKFHKSAQFFVLFSNLEN